MKDIISTITMKELEQITFRILQECFSQVMREILLEFDTIIGRHPWVWPWMQELMPAEAQCQVVGYPESNIASIRHVLV